MTAAAWPALPPPRRRRLTARLSAARAYLSATSDRLFAAFTADQWRRGMGWHAILWGAGYAIGPDRWASSGSFDVLRMVPVPIRAWGVVAVAVGVALLVRGLACRAHSAGAVLFFVWGVGLLLALPYGTAQSWGGWLHLLVVSAVHRHLSGVGAPPKAGATPST